MNHRIIARLDVKGPNLVKGVHLEGLRVLGSPTQFAEYYYEHGIDEILYMDVVASLYERNSLHSLISETAKKSFIPITVGGGIRTLEDIRSILKCGADKVAINTAAIKNPEFIREAAHKFGSSTIVASIETSQSSNGTYLAFTDNGRESTGVNAIEWAKRLQALGAGELLVTSIDKEGTGTGFDNDLIFQLTSQLSIPVIAHGGAGKISHIADCFIKGNAHAVAISSIIHYDTFAKLLSDFDVKEEGNIHFITEKIIPKFVSPAQIGQIKQFLIDRHIDCRPVLNEAL